MRIALVTARHVEPADTDDAWLTRALERRGAAVDWLTWDAVEAGWSRYDLVVLRSCWEYPQRLAEFTAWLDLLEREGARVLNPLPVVRENLHKRYLARLAAGGVTVPPLKLLPRGARTTFAALAAELGGDDLVIKPAVSGTAWRTLRSRLVADPQAELDALLAERDVVVQRFMPEIAAGEWSLVFLGGEFSHAALKRPQAGDFRCQHEFGGRIRAAHPAPSQLAFARRVLARVPGTLYARVDMVLTTRGPELMELELVEPQLFFRTAPDSADRAAALILDAARRATLPDAM